jgi:hypothetical protein
MVRSDRCQYRISVVYDLLLSRYDVSFATIENYGGTSLIQKYYASSLRNALSEAYPDHRWVSWRFSRVPSETWSDPANQKDFILWAKDQLGINNIHQTIFKLAATHFQFEAFHND